MFKKRKETRGRLALTVVHRGLWCSRLRDRRRQYSCKNAHTSEPSSWPVKVSCHYRFLYKFIDSCTVVQISKPMTRKLRVQLVHHYRWTWLHWSTNKNWFMILFLDLSYVCTSHVGIVICEKGRDFNQMLKNNLYIYYIA